MTGFGSNRRALLRLAALASAGAAGLAGTRPAAAQQNQPGGGMAQGQPQQGQQNVTAQLPQPGHRQGRTLEINGARIFVEESGNGEPMLLVHGYPLSGALFERVRGLLSGGYRVVTVDLRGFGMSHTPTTPDNIKVFADDVLATMQQLGMQKAIIGGMSMGGPIVFEMYKQAPDRFRGMALIDTGAAAAKPPEAGLWRGVAEMVRQNGVASILPVLMKDMLTGETRMKQPGQVQYLETMMKQASTEAATGGALALAQRPDATQMLGNIKVPVLITVGQDDPVYPVEIAQQMHQAIQGSTLNVIPGAAHAAVFENPEPSARAMAAWARDIR